MPHDRLEIRFYSMNSNKENLNPFFLQAKGISEPRAKLYVGWLKSLMEFYKSSFDEASEGDVKAFGNYLRTAWQSVWSQVGF